MLPLVETDWLAEQLDNPNLRILDCSAIHQDSDDGNRREYFSGRAEWEKAHIIGSVFADILSDLTKRRLAEMESGRTAGFHQGNKLSTWQADGQDTR